MTTKANSADVRSSAVLHTVTAVDSTGPAPS